LNYLEELDRERIIAYCPSAFKVTSNFVGHGLPQTRIFDALPTKMEDTTIDISIAPPSEKPIIEQMMQLYRYDMSEFDGSDLDQNGRFSYDYLDSYWTENSRTPLIIQVSGKLAGFVLVNQHSYTGDGRYSIAEFFIMRKYRRKGIGRIVARRVFNQFGPRWEIRQVKENMAAQSFWRRIIEDYTGGLFNEIPDGKGDWTGPIQIFERR
jgi:predicted acetyltransferase